MDAESIFARHHVLLPLMRRNYSDSFVDIIEDYAAPPDPEPNQADDSNGGDPPPKRAMPKSLSAPGITEIGQFGWKLFDYIEQALGLREEGDYQPKFEGGSVSKDCVECSWNSSGGGLLKGLDGILRGYRVCGLCSQTFCYAHCSCKRKLESNAEKEEAKLNRRLSVDLDAEHAVQSCWMLVCRKCYEKGETQELGQTRDHTSSFVKLRAKKINVVERRQDKILHSLEMISKKAPQGDSFSIWSLSSALPSAQELFQVGDNARKSCTVCESQFSFWVKHQACQLCSALCCTSCCNFAVPLARSPINPNGPRDRPGEVLVCKHCYHLISLKKTRIRFSEQCNSDTSNQMMKQYEYISALNKEIDKQLSDYLEKTEILDSTILDHFELVPKDRKEESTTVSFSDPVRTGSKKQFDKLVPLFEEFQKHVNQLLEMPAPTKRAKQVQNNIKTAFLTSEAAVLLSHKISSAQKSGC